MGGVLSSNPITGGIEEEHKYNLEQAKLAEQDALYAAAQRRREGVQLMGDQVVAYAASGVEIEGSPLNQIQSDLKDAELEAMNIVYSGKRRAADIRARSAMQRKNAYVSLGTQALMLGAKGGAGSSNGETVMKDGGGFKAASTGTNGYTISGGGTGTPGEMIS